MGMHWSDYRDEHPQKMRHAQEELFKLYKEGKLHTEITGSYPLDRAAEALGMLRDRRAKGKIVLKMESDQTIQRQSMPVCAP